MTIVNLHTNTSESLVALFLKISIPQLTGVGLVSSLLLIIVFASLFFAYGQVVDGSCFSSEVTFEEMFALSVHSFTTIGYGSVYPTCVGTNILVFLEYFSALLVTATFLGIFVTTFLRPRQVLRFSDKALITELEGAPYLVFRIVRNCNHLLKSGRVRLVSLMYWQEGQRKRVDLVDIPVEKNDTFDVHQWEVRHKIDELSPLHKDSGKRWRSLSVEVIVFDVAFGQEIRQYKDYDLKDVVDSAKFDDMLRFVQMPDGNDGVSIDHSKLSDYTRISSGVAEDAIIRYESLTEVRPLLRSDSTEE